MSERMVWCWWDIGDSEDGLTGFHTRADRDRFSKGQPGPFKRRVSEDGHTTSQTSTWETDMAAVRAFLKEPR